jgi:hypothetical protein
MPGFARIIVLPIGRAKIIMLGNRTPDHDSYYECELIIICILCNTATPSLILTGSCYKYLYLFWVLVTATVHPPTLCALPHVLHSHLSLSTL